ncbi:MAG: hypothetical protein J6X53_09015, partial [Abditibacteriota bacterium]|nr:hypothetical protein [Abditibacteriota bacterium]
GVREIFESGKYQEYLAAMSKFHNYSFGNTMLIWLTKPEATRVAGYTTWKSMGRYVKSGEKAISVLAPAPYKRTIREKVIDPSTQRPMTGPDGNPLVRERVIRVPAYKPVAVYDIGQTDGKRLPERCVDLTGDVENYEAFMEALHRVSPVPIEFIPITNGANGFFNHVEQNIAVKEGMGQMATVRTTIHEIVHSVLHNTTAPIPEDAKKYRELSVCGIPALASEERIDAADVPDGLFIYDLCSQEMSEEIAQDAPTVTTAEPSALSMFPSAAAAEYGTAELCAGTLITAKPLSIPEGGSLPLDGKLEIKETIVTIPGLQQSVKKDRNTREVEAESVAYTVCSSFNISTNQKSFGYVASWSKDKTLPELKASMETIVKTADHLITKINKAYAEVCKERGIAQTEPWEEALETAKETAAEMAAERKKTQREKTGKTGRNSGRKTGKKRSEAAR